MKLLLVAAVLAGSLSADVLAQCETQIIQSPLPTSAGFGSGLGLQGTRALIGFPFADAPESESGVAFAYELTGGAWVQIGTVAPAQTSANARFGNDIAIDGERALIGAYEEETAGPNAGAAYVFEWDGAAWVEQAKLVPAGLQIGDWFGEAVALDGDRAAIAATGDHALGFQSGAVYVFELVGSSWVEIAKLTGPPGIGVGSFGAALALDGDRLLVGAPYTDDPSKDLGAAFVFEWNGAGWELDQRLYGSNLQSDCNYGLAVALEGDRALVSSVRRIPPIRRGRVHTFELGTNGWAEVDVLFRNGQIQTDEFGIYLDLEGDSLLVAARDVEPPGPADRGAAYLFERAPGAWVETAELLVPDNDLGFANGLARDGERALFMQWEAAFEASVSAWSLPGFVEVRCLCGAGAPCANEDPSGGCANSTGEGASLAACGSTSVAQDDLTFDAHRLPTNQPALLFSGTQVGPGILFSDGRLCASSVLRRIQTTAANAAGFVNFGPGLGASGGWNAGDARIFQVWYRDNAGPCGSGSNLSSAVRMTFTL